jgi:hypothetical protein
MDLIASMRWKAANALTSSLSSEERNLLLQRLDNGTSASANAAASTTIEDKQGKTKNNPEVDVQHTIAEAVAAARAQEAQRSQQKWQAEKEALLMEAEKAARARVEADLAIQMRRMQFRQWETQVEQAKNKMNENDVAANVICPEENQPLQQPAQQKDMDTLSSSSMEDPSAHPLLGPCVLDLGYKRLHVVGTEVLTAIPVWEKQVRAAPNTNILSYLDEPQQQRRSHHIRFSLYWHSPILANLPTRSCQENGRRQTQDSRFGIARSFVHTRKQGRQTQHPGRTAPHWHVGNIVQKQNSLGTSRKEGSGGSLSANGPP